MAAFVLGRHYTRAQIHERLGGGIQDYLPHGASPRLNLS
jgi:hypothetical protein